MTDSQATYRVTFTRYGPLWMWKGWRESDDEYASPWGRGVALSEQNAIWAARRAMIGRIVKAASSADDRYTLDGDELVARADADHRAP